MGISLSFFFRIAFAAVGALPIFESCFQAVPESIDVFIGQRLGIFFIFIDQLVELIEFLFEVIGGGGGGGGAGGDIAGAFGIGSFLGAGVGATAGVRPESIDGDGDHGSGFEGGPRAHELTRAVINGEVAGELGAVHADLQVFPHFEVEVGGIPPAGGSDSADLLAAAHELVLAHRAAVEVGVE